MLTRKASKLTQTVSGGFWFPLLSGTRSIDKKLQLIRCSLGFNEKDVSN